MNSRNHFCTKAVLIGQHWIYCLIVEIIYLAEYMNPHTGRGILFSDPTRHLARQRKHLLGKAAGALFVLSK